MNIKAEKERLKRIKDLQKLEKQIQETIPKKHEMIAPTQEFNVGFLRLFRFATNEDKLKMIFGSLAAIVNGACIPMFSILYAQVHDVLVLSIQSSSNPSEKISQLSRYFLIFGVLCFFTGYIQQYCWRIAGASQSIIIRKQYYNALLRQDMTWYHKQDLFKLSNKVQQELFLVSDGVAEKVGFLLMTLTMGVSSLFQALTTHVVMTLVNYFQTPIIFQKIIKTILFISLTKHFKSMKKSK